MKRRIIFAPDSFKGTLTASELCSIMKKEFQQVFPEWEMKCLPMADGGEGFTESCLALRPGRRVNCVVTGPAGTPVEAYYAILEDGTAVIEMAAAAGLPLAGEKNDPMTATTYGVGELLLHAAGQGARRVILGLGGSATNDGGIGMARALGWHFCDAGGRELPAQAQYLGEIAQIRPPEVSFPIQVIAACDVRNPLCGPEGATYVFGPQKGVKPEQQSELDRGLGHLAALLEELLGKHVTDVPGSGAAGGLGAAVLAFLDGQLSSGAQLLLDIAGFDSLLAETEMVVTGEGCIDGQSSCGKIVGAIAARCQSCHVPCLALCGSIGPGAETLYQQGITAMFSSICRFSDQESICQTCYEDMQRLCRAVARLICRTGGRSSDGPFRARSNNKV